MTEQPKPDKEIPPKEAPADAGEPLLQGGEARNIFEGLFDMQFRTIITTRMMPTIYGLVMALAVLVCAFFTVEAFLASWTRGILWLFLLTPAIFLSIVVTTRIVLELVLVIFTLLTYVDQTVDIVVKISGQTDEIVTTGLPHMPLLRGWQRLRDTMLLRDVIQETVEKTAQKAAEQAVEKDRET
jgi:hypothetical protein